MTDSSTLEAVVPEEFGGSRLDVALAGLFSDYSRSRLQHWIRSGQVRLDGQVTRSTRKSVRGGTAVSIVVPEEPQVEACAAQDIPLNICFEDEHIIVIDKPSDLVMHPAVGNRDGTVQNALLFHYPGIEQIPRAGIVHRLDKDTTGLFVVARSLTAHASLVEQLQTRAMGREYAAVVVGHMVSGGSVDAPIGRHPTDRKRMAVNDKGKVAVTHYRVSEKFATHTYLNVKLETGRTHQIRVHFAHLHHPLVGDAVYGGRRRYAKGFDEQARQWLHDFPRQALHAQKLQLTHPVTKEALQWESPLPEDMTQLLEVLRTAAKSTS